MVLVSNASCYAPEVRDCTLKCETATECAADQVCNAGYCVGTTDVDCDTVGATADAGTPTGGGGGGSPPDAAVVTLVDAAIDAPPPDAPTHGTLTVTIDGKGSVVVQGIGLCASSCDFAVPLAFVITAYAVADDDFELDKWTTSLCPDAHNSSCSFVPQLTVEIGARFRKDN